MRRAMLALALAGCASQKSAESHADYVAQTQTVRTEGAERTVVVEEDYGQPDSVPDGRIDSGGPDVVRAGPVGVSPRAAPTPTLLKRTTTTIDRAPVVTTTKASADAHTDAESASRWNLGFGFWTKVLIAAGAALALLLAWRFRSGLLGGVLKLIGK